MLYDNQPLHESLETILASIVTAPQFSDIEVLKTSLRRERGVYLFGAIIDREGGVGTQLCEAVSKYIKRCIDELPPPVPSYQIEVSSAGLERPLLVPEHYHRFLGRQAKVITSLRIHNRVDFVGTIAAATEDAVTIADPHAGDTPIPYAAIKRAHLVYEPKDDLRKSRRQA